MIREKQISPFYPKLSFSEVQLYTPSRTHSKNIMPQNPAIAEKMDLIIQIIVSTLILVSKAVAA